MGVGCICPICASVNKWKFSLCPGQVDNVERDGFSKERPSSLWMEVLETDVECESASNGNFEAPLSFDLTCGGCRRVDDDGTWLFSF